jgi:hypothetical protein
MSKQKLIVNLHTPMAPFSKTPDKNELQRRGSDHIISEKQLQTIQKD